MFGKPFLKQSFELGLTNLKELMETNPPSPTGKPLLPSP
jgi:hypothetical protein